MTYRLAVSLLALGGTSVAPLFAQPSVRVLDELEGWPHPTSPVGVWLAPIGLSEDGSKMLVAERTPGFGGVALWTDGEGYSIIAPPPEGYDRVDFHLMNADATVFTGVASGPSGWQTFLWSEAGGYVEVAGRGAVVTDMSDSGDVLVGRTLTEGGLKLATRWSSPSEYEVLAEGTVADFTSADGQVVAGSIPYEDGKFPFLQTTWAWEPGSPLRLMADESGYNDLWSPQPSTVSTDGRYVFGAANGHGPYRWAPGGGVELLPKPIPEWVLGEVTDAVWDGTGSVGFVEDGQGFWLPCVWSQNAGVEAFYDEFLPDRFGIVVQDYTLAAALVTGDGLHMAGEAYADPSEFSVYPMLARVTPRWWVACRPDWDSDGQLAFPDVIAYLGAFTAGDLEADLDADDRLTFSDVVTFLLGFSECECPDICVDL